MKMNCLVVRCLLLTLLVSAFIPNSAATVVMVKGKITSRISATVAKPNRLIVNDVNGGWYLQEMEMLQHGAANSPYEIDLPLRITSTSGIFQVSLDEPLILRHSQTPSLYFQTAQVGMANAGVALRPLSVRKPVEFKNPLVAQPLQDTVGNYTLNIRALPPEGDFRTTTGIYQGELKLTFEPVAKAKQ